MQEPRGSYRTREGIAFAAIPDAVEQRSTHTLLLRGWDENGALVSEFTREVDVRDSGDGVYNVPVPKSLRSLSVSVTAIS